MGSRYVVLCFTGRKPFSCFVVHRSEQYWVVLFTPMPSKSAWRGNSNCQFDQRRTNHRLRLLIRIIHYFPELQARVSQLLWIHAYSVLDCHFDLLKWESKGQRAKLTFKLLWQMTQELFFWKPGWMSSGNTTYQKIQSCEPWVNIDMVTILKLWVNQ